MITDFRPPGARAENVMDVGMFGASRALVVPPPMRRARLVWCRPPGFGLTILRLTALVGLCGVVTEGSVPLGYLPAVGPAPLRFRPPQPPAPPVPLPPLLMGEPVTTPPRGEAVAQAATNRPTMGANLNVGVRGATNAPAVARQPAVSTNAVTVVAGESGALASRLEDTNSALAITPQMLVQFFKTAPTNGPGSSVVMPVFLPPAPPNPTGSSAVYKTP